MGCGCGGAGNQKKLEYVARFIDGSTKTYRTEIEARAAVARAGGGTVTPVPVPVPA